MAFPPTHRRAADQGPGGPAHPAGGGPGTGPV